MINRYKWYETLGIYVGIAAFLTFILAPFFEAFLVSLRPWREIVTIPYQVVTEGMGFGAYISVWQSIPLLWLYIWNSFFIGISATIITLIAVIPAAWAFARFRFWGRDVLLWSLLAINMVGATTLITPLFLMLMNLGLLNTYWALIVPGTAFLIPIGIWLLRSYFMRIPRELEEAAWADGASRLYILRRVIIPIAMPGIIVVTIATFIGAYSQQFLLAITFNADRYLHPLPVGLSLYYGGRMNEVMAAGLMGVLPVLIVFFFLQRHMVAGLTAGAVKS